MVDLTGEEASVTSLVESSDPNVAAAVERTARVSLSPTSSLAPSFTRHSRRSGGGNDNDDEKKDHKYASTIWDEYLKKDKGWKRGNGAGTEEWSFFPGSLLENPGVIKKSGEKGIHWANGWGGLVEMLTTYGPNHAPSSLTDHPEQMPKVPMKEIYDKLFEEEDVAAYPAPARAKKGEK